jgi:glycine/D-amino acid oxidase-like deaminating enzyme
MSPKHTSPGPFPSANPITSYWRNNTKSIDEHRSTEYLPSKADIVIVGAGYSGASIAYHLVQESERYGRPIPSIVILEAREACSGATGRNGMFLTLFVRIDPDWSVLTQLSGGHLKPDPYSRAASILKTHGKAVAEHVASFEARQINEIKDLVEREGIDCDFEETGVFDVCFYEAGRDKVKSDLATLMEANISTAKEVTFFSDADSEEVCTLSLISMINGR